MAENLDAALERRVARGITDAEVSVLAAESAARNDQQVIADRLGDEVAARAPGRLREQIERPAGLLKLIQTLETVAQQIALVLVCLHEWRDVAVPGRHAGVLHDARGADIRALLELDHLFDEPARSVAEAEPPTGHAVGLAEAVDNEYVLVELGGAGKRLVIDESAINLIANQQHATLAGKQRQIAKRVARIDDAGRICGAVDEDSVRSRCQGRRYFFHVDAEIRVRVDHNRLAARQRHKVRIHDEIRIEDDDFITWVDRAPEGEREPAAGAAGDAQLSVGVAVARAQIGRNLGPQFG